MKHSNIKTKLLSIFSGLALIALIAGLALAPTGSAYADQATPPAAAKGKAARDAHLEKVYQREQDWLNKQTDHLSRAAEVVTKVQTFIADQTAKGKDTSTLQAALTVFQQQLATAQSSHATAAGILGTHTGFDANGKVTDANQAHQTLIDARQSLRDAHRVLRQGGLDLHRALKAYRAANKTPGK
jgi:hypothetical protein